MSLDPSAAVQIEGAFQFHLHDGRIVVVVPLLVPLGLAFGIDPIHLGIIFLANMELGFLAPPVGLNLLLSSYRFNKPMVEVMRAVLPMLGVQFIGVLLITYVPPLTTLLPHWLAR